MRRRDGRFDDQLVLVELGVGVGEDLMMRAVVVPEVDVT
jgi:hypothetical protein